MEIRIKKCKSGNIWKLVNEGWSTSRAWGHRTVVIRNGYSYEDHKVRYYNRTWECYTYQTCMSGAIETIYQDELNRYIEDYKESNNIVRFKKGQKDEVIKKFDSETLGQDLLEIKEAIRDRNFDSI